MMKHLQTYNKQILAVVSMLLLVVFLAPSAVTQCSRVSAKPTSVWATTTDGATLTLGDLENLRGQLAVLEMLRDQMSVQLGLAKNPEHWWLLVKEAQDSGMIGGIADGRSYLDGAAVQSRMQPDELLGRLCASSRQQPQVVLQTLANLRGVERLIGLNVGAGRLSEARTRLAARELLTDVSCDVVPIDANTVGDVVPVGSPTADQLTATFEKGKTSVLGAGPGGIGYKFPDRAKLEWIVIPAGDVIRGLAGDPALGAVELRKEFRKNPGAFGVAAADLTPDKPAPSYEAYAPKVREAVERRLLKDRMERASSAVRDWSRISLKDVPVEGGIYKLPADWKTRQPALATLASELAQKFLIPAPAVVSTGDAWFTASDIDGHPVLGKTTTQEFGQPMRIGELIKELRDFNKDGRLPVQSGVIGPVVKTPNDDLIIWRITEAQAAHEPSSMDEVRDAVVRDATAQARYDALVLKTAQIGEEAQKDGLDAVAKTYGSSVEKAPSVHLADPAVLRQYGIRFPGTMPKAGQDLDAIRAVLAKAVSLPTANPINTLPDADRTLVVPVPTKLTIMVVRINDVKPLTIEDFRALEAGGSLRGAMAQDEPKIDWKVAFGKDAIAKRTGFELKNPDGPDRVMAPEAPAF
jgi:hypothetical protein